MHLCYALIGFEVNRRLYDISDATYYENLNYFSEVFGLGDIINQPVRLLSLGQKIRATIAGAMLQSPEILFLDEPTIGLDVTSIIKIRDFIKRINQKYETTVLLTTHDMGDIESLCERIILIDEGQKKYDGSILDFESAFGGDYRIHFKVREPVSAELPDGLFLIEDNSLYYVVSGNEKQIHLSDALSSVNQLNIEEFEIQKQTLEETINEYFG